MLYPHKQCQETRRLISEGAVLVDVRTEDEYRQGAIEGAINHPVQWISSGFVLQDKEKPLVVYCATGIRSRMAKEMLLGAGFNQVHDLGGLQNIHTC